MNPVNAVILLSGGLDSTVTTAVARAAGCALYALTISYGQRHQVEVERAKAVAEWFQVREHQIVALDLTAFGGSALTGDLAVPKGRSSTERAQGIPVTYVPARNTIFLSLALAYAETVAASRIYFGANVIDYSGYPDCRPEFIEAFAHMARLGTRAGDQGHAIEILAPLITLSKAEIVIRGQALGVPFHLTHSCYAPSRDGRACGECDSCVIRHEGFHAAGIPDPASAP